ncbi:MAG: hypothetical protein F4213_20305 [Boseongicola sp. SB0677_bin_26]|nr:hypothetical protein [Boseongicola sp. SB0665_bin_10]MYG28328.1 hypothetical protein [Boseongicola sp. SB0677_bin_26]
MQITVNALTLAAVSLARSVEEVRSYLQGVQFHPVKTGGLALVATDGHILICARDPQAEHELDEGVIVRLNATAKQLGQKCAGRDIRQMTTLIDLDAGTVTIPKGASFPASIIDGTFPDYGRVMPWGRLKPAVIANAVALNHEHLATAGQAHDWLTGGKAIQLWQARTGHPVLVPHTADACTVIMPMRDGSSFGMPEWIERPRKARDTSAQVAALKARRQKRRDAGQCIDCGKPSGGKARCPACADRNRR